MCICIHNHNYYVTAGLSAYQGLAVSYKSSYQKSIKYEALVLDHGTGCPCGIQWLVACRPNLASPNHRTWLNSLNSRGIGRSTEVLQWKKTRLSMDSIFFTRRTGCQLDLFRSFLKFTLGFQTPCFFGILDLKNLPKRQDTSYWKPSMVSEVVKISNLPFINLPL